MNIQELISKLSKIVGDDLTDGKLELNFRSTTTDEIRESLLKIKIMERELKIYKRELSALIKDKRSNYVSKSAKVGSTLGSFAMRLVAGRKNTGRLNTLQRDFLRTQKIEALEPYQNLMLQVDRIALAIGNAKEQLKLKKL